MAHEVHIRADIEPQVLENRCQHVQELMDGFATPWFVEFAGIPRSGKSGCISIVEHFLNRNGVRTLAPSEGAKRLPDFIKDSGDLVAYNIWTSTYAIREILEGRLHRRLNKCHIVLLDRGLFDAIAWFHFLEDTHKIEEEERKIMTKFVRIPYWRKLIKQVFLLLCSPDISIDREFENKLTTKHGATTQDKFLRELCTVYKTSEGCYEEDFDYKIFEVQTDNVTLKQLSFHIVRSIFDEVENFAAQYVQPKEAGNG